MTQFPKIDTIINDSLQALENSKKQIYDIYESTREESNRINRELEETKQEVSQIINQVEQLEKKEKKARVHLMQVSRNFKQYTEDDIRNAYEQAQDLQLQLNDLRHREIMARFKRDQLERSLKNLEKTLEKAENMMSQLSVVLNYLSEDLQSISGQINEMQKMQNLGINIIRAQEDERKRVAREIHDGPAQLLANIVMRAEFCLKLLEKEPQKAQQELKDLQELVRKSLKDVRQIIFDLRPMVLDDLGLVAAVKRYLAEYKVQNNLETELVCLGTDKQYIPKTTEVAIFRIIQECLNNAQKHAEARHITIKIEIAEKKINAIIRDDGKGFDLHTVENDQQKENYGLINIRERVSLLNGKLDIQSTPGRGTTITLSIPISDE
ncbi:MAG: sensor histidine kinase [Clostridiales bacterium]|nr:sensor histidine kinase [Clostridiales bacterium]MCF8023045.1 sensor histidine kinase [Clostridiales bacterium]